MPRRARGNRRAAARASGHHGSGDAAARVEGTGRRSELALACIRRFVPGLRIATVRVGWRAARAFPVRLTARSRAFLESRPGIFVLPPRPPVPSSLTFHRRLALPPRIDILLL